MNDSPHEENRRAADMTTADYIALAVMLLSMVGATIGFATGNLKLVWIANAVAFPATVVKVRLTRARSQAAEREEQMEAQMAERERRVRTDLRSAAERATAS